MQGAAENKLSLRPICSLNGGKENVIRFTCVNEWEKNVVRIK